LLAAGVAAPFTFVGIDVLERNVLECLAASLSALPFKLGAVLFV